MVVKLPPLFSKFRFGLNQKPLTVAYYKNANDIMSTEEASQWLRENGHTETTTTDVLIREPSWWSGSHDR